MEWGVGGGGEVLTPLLLTVCIYFFHITFYTLVGQFNLSNDLAKSEFCHAIQLCSCWPFWSNSNSDFTMYTDR